MVDSPVAIVTGGAQGLGEAICIALLDEDYKVCVADIQEQKEKQFVSEQQDKYGKDKVKFVKCDVIKEDHIKELFVSTLKEFKRIDLVVNNAGILFEQNPRKTVDVNLMGPIIVCLSAIQYMGKANGGNGGMIINIASAAGVYKGLSAPVYTATKYGVVGLTRTYGSPYYLEKYGIFFTAICPSCIDTEMIKDADRNCLIPEYKPPLFHEILQPEYVSRGVLKLLEDRKNGSILMITKRKGFTYVDYPEEVKDVYKEVDKM